MLIIRFAPHVERKVLPQRGYDGVREDGKHLVRLGLRSQGVSARDYPGSQLRSHGVRMPSHGSEQLAVAEQLLKLDPEQPTLGQHAATLLEMKSEVLVEGGNAHDDRLAQQRADFGAADPEQV